MTTQDSSIPALFARIEADIVGLMTNLAAARRHLNSTRQSLGLSPTEAEIEFPSTLLRIGVEAARAAADLDETMKRIREMP